MLQTETTQSRKLFFHLFYLWLKSKRPTKNLTCQCVVICKKCDYLKNHKINKCTKRLKMRYVIKDGLQTVETYA